MKRESKLKLVSISIIALMCMAQVIPHVNGKDDKKPKKPKKRNTIFMNYADNIVGNDMAIEGLDYELLWFSSGWTVFDNGTTGSDGLISFSLPAGFNPATQNYVIHFLNEWSHISDITQVAGAYASELELPVSEITVNVVYEDDSVVVGHDIEIYYEGSLVGTLTTDVNGNISFFAQAGLYEFTSDLAYDTVIVETDVSVSVYIIIVRGLIYTSYIGFIRQEKTLGQIPQYISNSLT